jgi:hypothetical protein
MSEIGRKRTLEHGERGARDQPAKFRSDGFRSRLVRSARFTLEELPLAEFVRLLGRVHLQESPRPESLCDSPL